jgi:hypothetical protein
VEPIPVGSVWQHLNNPSLLTVTRSDGSHVWYKFRGEDGCMWLEFWQDCVAYYDLVRIS